MGKLYLVNALMSAAQMNSIIRREFKFFTSQYPKLKKSIQRNGLFNLAVLIRNAILLAEAKAVLAQLHAFHNHGNNLKEISKTLPRPNHDQKFNFSLKDQYEGSRFFNLSESKSFAAAFASLNNSDATRHNMMLPEC